MLFRMCALLVAALFVLPLAAEAQKPVKVGFPMIMSGPGAPSRRLMRRIAHGPLGQAHRRAD